MAFSFTQHAPRPYMGNKYQREKSHNFHWKQNTGSKLNYSGEKGFIQKPFKTSEEFWCETCDRSFYTADLLEKHKKQHEKCNIDGCQFVAHPKVITKHIQMQHSSGIYKKIANLNNPEEIKKWIEERKKKYPTMNNIEKKAAQMKEKIERGEKMGLRKNEHNRNIKLGARRNHDNLGNRHSFRRNVLRNCMQSTKQYKHINNNNKIISKDGNNLLPVFENERKLKPFQGIQDLDMHSDTNEETEESDNNFSEDDDMEYSNKNKDITHNNEPVVCSALSSLICNYESSDEEEKTNNEVKIETLTSKNSIESQKKITCLKILDVKNTTENNSTHPSDDTIDKGNNSDCDSGPEEVKIERTTINDTNTKQTESVCNKKYLTKRKMNANETKHKSYSNKKPKIPSTLLQKLLSKEIQHERNIVLQCIRHIIKNDYFDT
ncbi:FMR1-interacting protein NUFIP1 [Galleria mellonella]|uniref:FMR1-interacting protein NUFIP1 n=1 Tax=Galleria mellonella TaxID=7137 RepID=A0ABM3MW00_GALME|nr:FMR1-interacting protein NUFIP1 [Galleria mellonella]XP_052755531.1 FMR1-interacting protein NUFIP1 [Galleria mellonella]XP_052755532.1 FMR1-interacting protein NUFIP1 [Galleria mellonella]